MIRAYTAVMADQPASQERDVEQHVDGQPLPRHLARLLGSLRGPADLALNHDKYLSYPQEKQPGGAATA